MKFFWLLALVPPVIAVVMYFSNERTIFDNGLYTVSASWSLLGTFFSYLGLLFSLFAALEVGKLSKKHFEKVRLPEIGEILKRLSNDLSSKSTDSIVNLMSSKIPGEVHVAIRSIERTKVKSLIDLLPKLKNPLHNLEEKKKTTSTLSSSELANGFAPFWDLVSALSEVADEIDSHLRDTEARS